MVSSTLTLSKKIKNLSKNWWSLVSFCYSPNNFENVSHKTTEFNKEKNRGKEDDSSQSVKSNDLYVLDRVRLNNADMLIIGHLNINSLRNNFEMLREIVQNKLNIMLISGTKSSCPSFPSSQFSIKDFRSPFWLVRNSSGGGIMHDIYYMLGRKFLQNS